MVDEKLDELDRLLEEQFKVYGFKKKKKRSLKRSKGDCIQEIIVGDTKVRGQDRVHIYIHIGVTLKKLNNLVMELQNDYRYKGWATFVENMNGLIPGNEVFGFYIDSNTDLNPIVDSICDKVKEYGLPFLESCDTNEKLALEIEKNNKTIIDLLYHKYGWIRLALDILLNHQVSKDTIKEYLPDVFEDSVAYQALLERINKKNNR